MTLSVRIVGKYQDHCQIKPTSFNPIAVKHPIAEKLNIKWELFDHWNIGVLITDSQNSMASNKTIEEMPQTAESGKEDHGEKKASNWFEEASTKVKEETGKQPWREVVEDDFINRTKPNYYTIPWGASNTHYDETTN